MNITCPNCEKIHKNIKLPFYCSCLQYISVDLINHINNSKKSMSKPVQTQSPSFIEKAKNFTKSVINHVAKGMVKVSDTVKQERMDICKSCPFFNQTDPKNPTCNKCGCFLDVKTGWASEKCPEGKWLEVKTQSSGGCGCSKKT
jgi:hypothetical protein